MTRWPGIWRFTVRRLLIGLGQVAILLGLIFALSLLMPGDAADVQSTDLTTDAQRDRTRAALGLDVAPVQRFLGWAGRALTGDLGTSYARGEPVSSVIAEPLLVSTVLAILTTLLLIPVGFGAGFAAGLRPGSMRDRIITTVSIGLDSIPDFVLAVVLIAYLAIGWRLFPATFVGVDAAKMMLHPTHLVLPLTVMVARVGAPLVRLVRAGVIDTMTAPYIVQARRHGVPRRSLLLRHVAPNALAPAMQDLGRTGDSLLSGVLVVEAIFVMPGVATTLLDAIGNRDQPVILAVLLITGLAAIAVNGLIDLAGARMVPSRAGT
ncbi:ABC transporter permease [Mycobacterium sp. TNTM28]|uniref:ABC transporter permease n=1 Tax=[Mycobacterium] fortunisiensis TaxID=2600579 RepID=A0ABS6KGF3_9MYCO|nr:ABC transporter permease [[Mycobacterium] fortunisiensis]MBU9762620.1 ABC transporter permease [[Mycobacterium] fortunisiensis]